jgi:hypothetical protein
VAGNWNIVINVYKTNVFSCRMDISDICNIMLMKLFYKYSFYIILPYIICHYHTHICFRVSCNYFCED